MKQFPSTIYKRFMQQTEVTAPFQCTTIAVIPEKISVFDVTLAAGKSWDVMLEMETLFVLPLAGNLQIESTTITRELTTGKWSAFSTPNETSIVVTNPYHDETVNFLCLRMHNQPSENAEYTIQFPQFTFQNAAINSMIRQFGNREEFEYSVPKSNQELLVICLAGAFEFENRLIEDREALRLIPIDKCEMESLIEGSILLFIHY